MTSTLLVSGGAHHGELELDELLVGVIDAAAGAEYGLIIDLPGHSEARGEVVVVALDDLRINLAEGGELEQACLLIEAMREVPESTPADWGWSL